MEPPLYAPLSEAAVERITGLTARWRRSIIDRINEINSLGIVFFTRGDDVANLNRAMLYVRANEETKRIKVVHVYKNEADIPENLQRDVELLLEQ